MKTILITLGDSGGLGPELVTRYFAMSARRKCRILIIGLESSLLHLGNPFWTRLHSVQELSPTLHSSKDKIFLFEPPELAELGFSIGRADPRGGQAAGVSLDWAVRLLKEGIAHGLCTCPLNKAMLAEAGFDFPGHTEFLAEKFGQSRESVCMHLAGSQLRVSLVTTHPPLSKVPSLIHEQRIVHCLDLTAKHLASLGIAGTIGVCGLNPHAGESGKIGHEDAEIIAPAIQTAQHKGIKCEGPLPADTLFYLAAQGRYAAVLAMYHDQGLAPLKLLHFSEAVNVTLGLPYPRTSPDHGTGYDLVGTGKADVTSFSNAMSMLENMLASNS